MDYNSLADAKTESGSIRRWVNHSDVDVGAILTDAQALIYQTLRVREMRTVFSDIVINQGADGTPLPAGFLDPIRLIDKTNNARLRLKTEEWIEDRREYENGNLVTGTPRYFGIYNEAIRFEVAYDAAATLRLVGYQTPALLIPSNPSNWLTVRYPHILRSAAIARAFNYRNNDERADKELMLLAAYIAKANAESDFTYRGLEADNEVV